MATAIKTLVKNIRKKFDRRFQNVFFSIICYTQATKEKTNSVGKLGTWWWSRRTWANLFWWKHKITTNCWSTIDKKLKKKKTGGYQKRYPTYKDKEEITRRWWKWKSLRGVWFFVTSWTIQSVEFSSPEYWSG